MASIESRPAGVGRLDSALATLIGRAWRRLFLAGYVRRAGWSLTVAFGVLSLVAIGQRLTPSDVLTVAVLGWSLAAALVVPAVWTLVRMPRGMSLADEVDRRAGMRERLSTAYLLSGSGDGWSRAVMESAVDGARRVVLRDAIPVRAGGVSANGPLVGVVVFAALAMFMPRYDMTGVLAQRAEEEKERERYELAAAEVKANEDRLEEVLSRAGVELTDDPEQPEAADASKPEKPRSADEVRREAIRKLTRVSEQLEAVKENENAKTLRAMQQSMRQLKAAPPGPAQQFQQELARGNFAAAKEHLEQLAQRAANGEMSAEQREQLGEQLGQLAEQLERLSRQNESLEEAMREAGMTAEQAQRAARDPSSLEQMLNQLPGIPVEQMQTLRQMAQAQQNANQSMQSMAQAAEQMGEACENPGEGSSGQMSSAAAGMSGELSGAEMMAAEQSAADAAMSEAQGQLASLGESMCEGGACMGGTPGESGPGQTGRFRAGDSSNTGRGSGGPGRGTGASPEALPTDYVLKREKANVMTRGGPIIGSTVVHGSQVRGESRAQFGRVVDAASVEAAEALETMSVPREFHDAVKAYFGRLEEAARSKDGATPDGGEGGGE